MNYIIAFEEKQRLCSCRTASKEQQQRFTWKSCLVERVRHVCGERIRWEGEWKLVGAMILQKSDEIEVY